jgi:N-acetylneuraminate synthase
MITIAGREIGKDRPVFVVAEVGINHNGDMATARALVMAAADAGADAVKFQVGDPDRYVLPDRRDVPRETPWGVLPYVEYRRRLELSDEQLTELRDLADACGLIWFASALDVPTVARLEALGAPCHKIASPWVTDLEHLTALRETGKPALLSTGMSTIEEIDLAVAWLEQPLALLHCTSAYPCPPELANLRMIPVLRERYGLPVGYSGHEVGVPESVAAVAMGACIVERHLTLSRAMWGSDHGASLEPTGLETLVRYIRTVEVARGDGVKRVYTEEANNRAKFRRVA